MRGTKISTAFIAGALALAGCGGSSEDGASSVEWSKKDLGEQLKESLNVPRAAMGDATCKKGLPAVKNASTTCTISVEGQRETWLAIVKPAGKTGGLAPEFRVEGNDGEGNDAAGSTPAVDCSDEGLSQAEWIEHCDSEEDFPAEGENPLEPVKVAVGKAHTYLAGTVTVDKLTCGILALPDVTIDETPATADEGQEFCVVFATVENRSKKPLDSAPTFYAVQTSDGTTYAGPDDTLYGGYDGVDFGGFADTINPKQSVQFASAFQVPKGERPTSVLTESEEDGMLVEDPDDYASFELPNA
ncbi:DUF4352 domain-containing protein [Demetria terragena]|uniref:DUF4352 domain-containing protein n=1 Tax=Demetria terragena TaxID=63959 RepID=UPI0003699506|nr:DUF4352 domain-containing protein [Demetria terragena]